MRKVLLALLITSLIPVMAYAQSRRPTRSRKAAARVKPARVPTFDEFLATQRTGWRLAAEGTDVKLYYDPARLTRPAKGVVRLWVKFVNQPPRGDVARTVALQEYDCARGRHRSIAFTDYDLTGKSIATTEDSSRPWRFITPETITEKMFAVVCKGAKDKEQVNLEYAAAAYDVALGFERAGDYENALFYFEEADGITPNVEKIVEAIKRVKTKVAPAKARPMELRR